MTARPTPAPRRRAVRRDALVNREKILTVAAELMAQRGRNVPLAEIAGAAGVGVGTFYRGFPDRTALLHALELRAYDMLIAVLDRIKESGQTGADAVETYLDECLNLGDQLVLPLRGAPPLADDAAIAARARINAVLEGFLADGRADGTVRADFNATDIIICGAMMVNHRPPAHLRFRRRHPRARQPAAAGSGGDPRRHRSDVPRRRHSMTTFTRRRRGHGHAGQSGGYRSRSRRLNAETTRVGRCRFCSSR
jgi:AcrR family transcriptional regulator